MERAHQTLKNQLIKLQDGEFKYSSPHHILNHALFVINNLNLDTYGHTAMEKHWNPDLTKIRPFVKWKDLSGQWRGPDLLITFGRGYACIFPQDADAPVWVPDGLIRYVTTTTSLAAVSADEEPL